MGTYSDLVVLTAHIADIAHRSSSVNVVVGSKSRIGSTESTTDSNRNFQVKLELVECHVTFLLNFLESLINL